MLPEACILAHSFGNSVKTMTDPKTFYQDRRDAFKLKFGEDLKRLRLLSAFRILVFLLTGLVFGDFICSIVGFMML